MSVYDNKGTEAIEIVRAGLARFPVRALLIYFHRACKLFIYIFEVTVTISIRNDLKSSLIYSRIFHPLMSLYPSFEWSTHA